MYNIEIWVQYYRHVRIFHDIKVNPLYQSYKLCPHAIYFSVDHFTNNELFQYRTLWKLWELVKKLCFSKIWMSGSFVKWHESSKLILNQKLCCCIPTHLWWWQPFLNWAISSTSGHLVALSGHSEQITIFDGWLK